MKLKKRIMACVVAAAVVVTSAVTAMAAGSIDKTGKADGYKVAVVDTTTPIYQEISKTAQAVNRPHKNAFPIVHFSADARVTNVSSTNPNASVL